MKILKAAYHGIFTILSIPFILAIVLTNLISKVLYVLISLCATMVLMFNPKILESALNIIKSMTVDEQGIIDVHVAKLTAKQAEEVLKAKATPKRKYTRKK